MEFSAFCIEFHILLGYISITRLIPYMRVVSVSDLSFYVPECPTCYLAQKHFSENDQ